MFHWGEVKRRWSKQVRRKFLCLDVSPTFILAEWSMSHAFFLLMGGFMACDRNYNKLGVILPPLPNDWETVLAGEPYGNNEEDRHWNGIIGGVENPIFRKAIITHTTNLKDSINDKSKSNLLTKALVIGQTMWFLIQCTARVIQGHDVTQLELLTVAFVLLNVVTAFLWKDKPANVDSAIPIIVETDGHPVDDRKTYGAVSVWATIHNVYWDLSSYNESPLLWRILVGAPLVLFFPFIYPPVALSVIGSGIMSDNRPVTGATKSVPPFYSHWKGTKQNLSVEMIISLLAVAVVFGGIHIAGWSSPFPTDTEMWIWRAAALATIAFPCFLLPVVFYLVTDIPQSDFVEFFMSLVFFTSPIFYALSRLTLMAQAFMLLRSLPLGAYQTVQWTTFIPHI